jgi:hypothetical protein
METDDPMIIFPELEVKDPKADKPFTLTSPASLVWPCTDVFDPTCEFPDAEIESPALIDPFEEKNVPDITDSLTEREEPPKIRAFADTDSLKVAWLVEEINPCKTNFSFAHIPPWICPEPAIRMSEPAKKHFETETADFVTDVPETDRSVPTCKQPETDNS